MRSIRALLATLLLCLISACGTGTTGQGTSEPTLPSAAQPGPPPAPSPQPTSAPRVNAAATMPQATEAAPTASTVPGGAGGTTATVTQGTARFDGSRAYDHVLAQMQFGKRDAGTPGNRQTSDYIGAQVKRAGWTVEYQEFQFRGVTIRNVIGKRGRGPLLVLGAHFDTRKFADQDKQHPDQPVPGANDGASGVAVLLELARVLDASQLKYEVWLAFFDAEDNGEIDNWPWSVGAAHVAENLPSKPAAVIVLDMIGDASQDIYFEGNSDMALQKEIFGTAARLGYRQYFIPEVRWSMTDDHTPFLERGIRAVDLIDFDYPYWHTIQDTADKVSAASLEHVGRTIQVWITGQ